MARLQIGDAAPHFTLEGDDGQQHSPHDHTGTYVVLYFYPKDNTPGCTTEACDFRDNMQRLTSQKVAVYGVSKDSLASHARFKEKQQLNFVLLSDPTLETHKAYDAWGEKKLYGKTTQGVIRSTFIIGPQGTIEQCWYNVRAKGHVAKVMTALDELCRH